MEAMRTLSHETTTVGTALRRLLLRLAKAEEDRAADEAATVPYWMPCPASVLGHRLAAETLRAAADTIG